MADACGGRARSTRAHNRRRPLCRMVDRRHGPSFARAPRYRPRASRRYRLAGSRGQCSSRASLPLDRGWPIPVDRTLALPPPGRHPGLSDLKRLDATAPAGMTAFRVSMEAPRTCQPTRRRGSRNTRFGPSRRFASGGRARRTCFHRPSFRSSHREVVRGVGLTRYAACLLAEQLNDEHVLRRCRPVGSPLVDDAPGTGSIRQE